jgi:quinol monooxygenase YgiN
VIIGTHAPVNEEGTDYNRSFMDVLEKYSVDLVLAGHYHSESFKTTYLDKTPYNSNIGVTYMRGAGGGIKAIGEAKPEDFAKGYIIDVLEDKIVIKYIDGNGKIRETKTVVNNKLHEKENATKQELLDSITPAVDIEKGTITFDWSSKFFKNVKEMTLTEDYRDQRKAEFIFPTPGYVRYSFDKISNNYDSQYTFKITFDDGTVEYKTFVYELKGGIGLVASEVTADSVKLTYEEPNEADKVIVKEYEVYINGVLLKTYNAKDLQNNTFVTSTMISGLTSNTDYTLKVRVVGRYGFLYADQITFKTK